MTDDNKQRLARELRRARDGRRLTRAMVQELTGGRVTDKQLAHYEGGRASPTRDQLRALARVYGISTVALATGQFDDAGASALRERRPLELNAEERDEHHLELVEASRARQRDLIAQLLDDVDGGGVRADHLHLRCQLIVEELGAEHPWLPGMVRWIEAMHPPPDVRPPEAGDPNYDRKSAVYDSAVAAYHRGQDEGATAAVTPALGWLRARLEALCGGSREAEKFRAARRKERRPSPKISVDPDGIVRVRKGRKSRG